MTWLTKLKYGSFVVIEFLNSHIYLNKIKDGNKQIKKLECRGIIPKGLYSIDKIYAYLKYLLYLTRLR